ncbi:hypothetical protein D9M70_460230 [compost metagenome]
MLQRDLVGRLVLQAAVQRHAYLVAAVAADDLLGGPVEVELDLLGLAQAAAAEAVGLRQEAALVEAEGALLAESGDQHRGLEIEGPAAVVFGLEVAGGAAADRQLLPVGGVADREGFEFEGVNWQSDGREGGEQQCSKHGIS